MSHSMLTRTYPGWQKPIACKCIQEYCFKGLAWKYLLHMDFSAGSSFLALEMHRYCITGNRTFLPINPVSGRRLEGSK